MKAHKKTSNEVNPVDGTQWWDFFPCVNIFSWLCRNRYFNRILRRPVVCSSCSNRNGFTAVLYSTHLRLQDTEIFLCFLTKYINFTHNSCFFLCSDKYRRCPAQTDRAVENLLFFSFFGPMWRVEQINVLYSL